MASEEKAVFIVPVHNERDTIGFVVKNNTSLETGGAIYSSVYVFDNTNDGSREIALAAGAKNVIVRSEEAKSGVANGKKGKGESCFDGLLFAMNSGASIALFGDADRIEPINAVQINRMVQPIIRDSRIDRVIYSQQNGSERVRWPNSGHYSIRLSVLAGVLFEKMPDGTFAHSDSLEARFFRYAGSGYGFEMVLHEFVGAARTRIIFSDPIKCLPRQKGSASGLELRKDAQDDETDTAWGRSILLMRHFKHKAQMEKSNFRKFEEKVRQLRLPR